MVALSRLYLKSVNALVSTLLSRPACDLYHPGSNEDNTGQSEVSKPLAQRGVSVPELSDPPAAIDRFVPTPKLGNHLSTLEQPMSQGGTWNPPQQAPGYL
jgi:hypothetical protein